MNVAACPGPGDLATPPDDFDDVSCEACAGTGLDEFLPACPDCDGEGTVCP